jgi:Ca2+-binding RTX toxin-like protein
VDLLEQRQPGVYIVNGTQGAIETFRFDDRTLDSATLLAEFWAPAQNIRISEPNSTLAGDQGDDTLTTTGGNGLLIGGKGTCCAEA